MLWTRSLLGCVVIATGCGDGSAGNAAVDACEDIAEAYCLGVFDCCESDSACDPSVDLAHLGGTASACAVELGTNDCPAFEALSENENVGLDQTALEACSQDVEEATCMELGDASGNPIGLCTDSVFNPTQDLGDPCEVPQECISGVCGSDGLCGASP